MRIVWRAKDEIIVMRRTGPSIQEPATKQKVPRRKAPTAIRALTQSLSWWCRLPQTPRARLIMFPVGCQIVYTYVEKGKKVGYLGWDVIDGMHTCLHAGETAPECK